MWGEGMRRILVGVAVLCLATTALAATPTFDGTYNAVPNDYWPSGVDTVCSHASWCDTIIPDGISNYAVTVFTPSDANTAGLYVNLSLSSGNENTGWMLLRDEIGVWTWEAQVDTVFVRGAGTADTTGITRYEVLILQEKHD